MIEVRLMGTFEISYDGQPVTLSSRAAQSLFAYLVLTAGTSHRREKLAGMFWPDVTEEKARAYLRHELWRIRKAFHINDFLLSNDIGVSFEASTEFQLDAHTLEKLRDTASADELMVALSSYRGELLPGFYDEWVILEREHLNVLYEQKITRFLELLEQEKRWNDILEWAEQWISHGGEPEAAYRYLMVAYIALGEHAKVNSTYERCVKALRELNLEPSEQTRALVFRRTHSLKIPIPLTSFIGRENELKEVAALLSRSRLVTLTGSGGVGKTRLSIQVVADVLERFPDGVWFLDLAPVSDPELVSNTLANVLNLRLMGGSDSSYTDLVTSYLRSRTALIIFDNCEHLIEASAQLVHSLLTACETLSILATSREALRVAGETPYRVPSLQLPRLDIESVMEALQQTESVRLFMERAVAISPGFALGLQNAFLIAQICQRLGGIPLAIELAAARINLLSVDQILQRLDDRFNLLTSGSRTALPRHQTLRATIEWSYDLLPGKEQLLFQRLAVFSGGWTLEAAEAVCSGDELEINEILDLLSHLVDKSLVLAEAGSDGTRYRRLETIRQFACEKLFQSEEGKTLGDRHLAYFLDLAEYADREIHGPNQLTWMDRLELDHDNYRAALNWCVSNKKTESALRLLNALRWTWAERVHFNEEVDWFDKIRTLPNVSDHSALYARLLNFMADESRNVRDYHYALSFLKESQAIWLKLGANGELGFAESLDLLGLIAGFNEGNYKAAQSLIQKSFQLYQKHRDEWGMAREMFRLGEIAWLQGNYPQAEEYSQKSLAKLQELDDKVGMGLVFNSLGDLMRLQGDYLRARRFCENDLEISRESRNRLAQAYPLSNLAWISLHESDYREAIRLFKESFELYKEHGMKARMVDCLAGIGGVLGMTGKFEQAVRIFGAVESFYEGIGEGWRMDRADQKDYNDCVAFVLTQLDESIYIRAWNLGRSMILDEVMAYAFEELQ